MKNIIVNNPAAVSRGALSILTQFLENIEKYDNKNNYYIFVSLPELKKYEKENIKIIVVNAKKWIDRIKWDAFELKKTLRKYDIRPDLGISFQNTAMNLGKNIPIIVYFHQSLVLNEKKWNFFKKSERLFWIYKNILSLFIKMYLKNTKLLVVQAEWIKILFNKKFKYNLEKIKVIRPYLKVPKAEMLNNKNENFNVFYPAFPDVYKNHEKIIEMLEIIKEDTTVDFQKIKVNFTFSENENIKLKKMINDKKLHNTVFFVGKLKYEEVIEYYKNSDMLIFPSYIETFGLPLIEAASFGLPILTLDLPYSNETIGEYLGANFVDAENIESWKNTFIKIMRDRNFYTPLTYQNESGWDLFFSEIKELVYY